MKNIIHMKIPMDGRNFTLSMDIIAKFVETVKNNIGNDYKVIVTPFDCECIDENENVITIDCKKYSYKELVDIINKN